MLAGLAGWQWLEADASKRAAIASEEVATEQRKFAEAQTRRPKRRSGAVAERDRAERNLALARGAAEDLVFKIAQGLRDVQGMRVESIGQTLRRRRSVMEELVKSAPDDAQLQRSRGAMFVEFATTYLIAGDLTRAQAAAEESLAIMRKLLAADAGNAGRQHDVSVSLERSATCGLRPATGRGACGP